MSRRKWIGLAVLVLGVTALSVFSAVMAQRPPVLARAVIAGEVISQHLVAVGQMVRQGDPLVYVRGTTRSEPVLAALAPVDGQVTRVTVRPGTLVNIGDIVAVIQP